MPDMFGLLRRWPFLGEYVSPVPWNQRSWKHMTSYSSLMAIKQFSLLCFTHKALGNASHVWIASSEYLWESMYRQYSETLAQDVMWLSTRWPPIISVFQIPVSQPVVWFTGTLQIHHTLGSPHFPDKSFMLCLKSNTHSQKSEYFNNPAQDWTLNNYLTKFRNQSFHPLGHFVYLDSL